MIYYSINFFFQFRGIPKDEIVIYFEKIISIIYFYFILLLNHDSQM